MFGISTGIAISLISGVAIEDATLITSTCMIGSIFPDIDNPSSLFGKLTKPISTFIGKANKLMGHSREHHRGIIHDIGLWIILLILSWNYFPYLKGFFIGGVSHLFLDAFNPSGDPFLIVKRFRLAKIPSDSKEAVAISFIFSGVFLLAGILYKVGLLQEIDKLF